MSAEQVDQRSGVAEGVILCRQREINAKCPRILIAWKNDMPTGQSSARRLQADRKLLTIWSNSDEIVGTELIEGSPRFQECKGTDGVERIERIRRIVKCTEPQRMERIPEVFHLPES